MAALARKGAKKTGQKRPRAIGAERLSLTLTENSGRALFAQIREHVRDLIARGLLVPGMRLPPVRGLLDNWALIRSPSPEPIASWPTAV